MDKATGSNARYKKPVSQIVVIVSKYGQNFEFSLARKVALPHPSRTSCPGLQFPGSGSIVFSCTFSLRGRISETSGFDPRIVLFLPIPTRTKFQIVPGYSVSQAEPLDTTFFNTAHSKFKAGAIAAVLSSIMSCHPGSFRNSFSKLNMGPWINIFPNHCHFNS